MGSIFSKSFKANANNNNEKICFLQELFGYFPESDKIFERNTNLQGLAKSLAMLSLSDNQTLLLCPS